MSSVKAASLRIIAVYMHRHRKKRNSAVENKLLIAMAQPEFSGRGRWEEHVFN